MPRVFDGVIWIRRAAEFNGTTRYGRPFAPPKWHIHDGMASHKAGDINITYGTLCGYVVKEPHFGKPKTRATAPQAGDRCVPCLKKHLKALEQLPAKDERIEA